MARGVRSRLAWAGFGLAVILSNAAPIREGLGAERTAPTRWALLIGIDDYTELGKLRFAGNDQRALAKQLVDSGFPQDQVFLLHEKSTESKYIPSRENIEKQIDLVLGLANRGDLLIVGFSGHGVQLEGKSYFCPMDTRLDKLAATMIPLDTVYDRMSKCKAALKLLMVDACRNDILPAGRRSVTLSRSLGEFSDLKEKPPEGILLLASCGPGQVSMEDEAFGHGVFMHYLLEGLKGKAANATGAVSLAGLYDYASLETKKYVARKFNEYQTPALRGEISGPFEIVDPDRREPKGRQVTAVFTIREVDENGQPFAGVKLEIQYRAKPEAEPVVLGRGASDEQGETSIELFVTPAQEREGEFLAVMSSNRGAKTDAIPGFPKSLRWNLYVPRLPMENMQPADAPKVETNSIDMKMVLVPAGEFMMGSGESAEVLVAAFAKWESKPDVFKDEYPQHRVRITRPFYLGAHEVTVGQFHKFVEDSGYKTDAEKNEGFQGANGFSFQTGKFGRIDDLSWRNLGFPQTDEHPVACVSWNDAVAFCRWLGRKEGKDYRLPTEAEWEYACRGGTTTRYSSGDDPETVTHVGNVRDAAAKAKFPNWSYAIDYSDGYAFTAPVGRFKANAFGLYDMHGNVREWCVDWYGESYYAASPPDDPKGPDSGTLRALRGGSWLNWPCYVRSSFRIRSEPNYRDFITGFRVVRIP